MTLLVISPDYASHLLPLATLATRWRDAGERVVVATGSATAAIVESFGYERIDLPLGRGSNAGVIRAEEQPDDEADSLRGFFDATRTGMVETLLYQARERLTDLMWDPVDRGRRTLEVVAAVAPDAILVDHLAFSARMALQSSGLAYGDVVLGHPSALPRDGQVYGEPAAWPDALHPAPEALAELRAVCERVSSRFTADWNRAAEAIDPAAGPIGDAFASHGGTVLYNYPAELAPDRDHPGSVFLGSALRAEPEDEEVEQWIASGEPYVYVSFGSFLSVRGDVLARVAAALRRAGVRAAIAHGSTPAPDLGDLPSSWLVREYLPQVRLLRDARAAVTHGGNNSVTEALSQGVPLVVLPFSTDQFAGAAAIERARTGVALDANAASVEEICAALEAVFSDAGVDRALLARLRAAALERGGPQIAYDALTASRDETSARIASESPDAAR